MLLNEHLLMSCKKTVCNYAKDREDQWQTHSFRVHKSTIAFTARLQTHLARGGQGTLHLAQLSLARVSHLLTHIHIAQREKRAKK